MEQKNINTVTLMLAAVAGYCDIVTFIAGDNIFSAHVTGNFIVFAYQMATGGDIDAWIKLITFPIFIIAVITGGLMSGKVKSNKLLFVECLLLIAAGFIALFYNQENEQKLVMYIIILLIVFALGLQNAFGKLFSKATYGPTTMMTGNVTQASLDLGALLFKGFKSTENVISFKKQLITISGFLLGCLTGAFAGKYFGLAAILLAGGSMLVCYIISKNHAVQNQ
ncbi:YoaK family protein [Flavobacterium sp. NRK1]|uniref:YoaK family protein n=1 Tax=Flavobacterium sp. NRK1 TaxID=2954929 RepID=UPI0020930FCE|nr:YoaK family protein [Flavobacterium sp. NRK1]MCO6149208.1 DUF1275 domain-containing protein [Flavobacterium sp. NRK1]